MLFVAAWVLGPCAGVAEAAAPADEAMAEQLFTSGKALMNEHRWPEACAKFDAARKLSPGIGITLWLAECHERGGRLASAWLFFREAATTARAKGDPRGKVAEGRVEQLLPRLARLRIVVPAGWGGQVLRDDLRLPREVLGEATPIDPGRYRYRFLGDDGETSELTVEIAEEGRTYEIKPADATPVLRPPSTTPPPPVAASAAVPPPAAPPSRLPGWLALGAGAIAAGVGAGFGLDAASKQSASDDGHCVARSCDAEGVRLRDAAFDSALVSTVAFAVSGVAIAAGVLVFTGVFDRRRAAALGSGPPRGLAARW
jgi:hypothetical protein